MPYKRTGTKYWQITVSGVRQSSRTTDYGRAKTLEHKLNTEAWDARKLGVRHSTWNQACLAWFKRNAALKSIQVFRYYSDFWEPHLNGKSLAKITPEIIREVINKERPVNPMTPVPANTTANLHMAFVVRVLRNAGLALRAHYLPEPKGREEWLTVEQWLSLEMSDDLRQVATFSLATGLREANVIGLQWDWVKGDSVVIPADFTKTARTYAIPLNNTAKQVIQERRGRPVIDARSVFQLQGRSIYRVQLGRLWKAVLSASGVPHMPYHGLRHTYASWMVQSGVPFEIVARLGQWKLPGMVHRYAHFDVESLRQSAERFDTFLAQQTSKLSSGKELAG
jgi:integrase